jgi:hypothetical protein
MDGAHKRTLERALQVVKTKERLAVALEPPLDIRGLHDRREAPTKLGRIATPKPPEAYAEGVGGSMDQFIKHFRREGAGIWLCFEAATVYLPQGRVQATAGTRFVLGHKFMNVDVARALDEEYARQHDPRR